MSRTAVGVALAVGSGLLLVGSWSASAQGQGAPPPPPPPPAPVLGGPLSGLDANRRADFEAGKREFTRQIRIEEGLGPVFNGRSCAECHAAPAPGGSSGDLARTNVTRIGRLLNGVFDPLEAEGGSQLQRRSLRELDPRCPIVGEVVPRSATIVSIRATPAVFGSGLLEAIPESDLLSRTDPDDRNRDGISGRANRLFNPESGRMEIGRFGWKGSVPTVHLFTAGAYQGELGVTNPTFPLENLPQGRPIPAGWDRAADPEEGGGAIELTTRFQRYLAPPQQRPLSPAAARGAQLFTSVGCAACHTPSMRTAGSDSALAGRTAMLYSDLLLHDMGPGLSDRMPAGEANGAEWRTTPLWGVSAKRFWLHDGRARSIDAATRAHAGEGTAVTSRYTQLKPADRNALLQFLNAL